MQSLLGKWMPANFSQHGGDLDAMSAIVHWLMLALFVGWGIYFVVVLVRFRAGASERARYEGTKGKVGKSTEVAVAVIEAVILIGFAIPAWASWVTPHDPEEDPLEVRLVAEQFAWNVHYAGPDGVFGRTAPELVDTATNPLGLDAEDPAAADDVATINQLHLPVGRPVTVRISSKDVIHGFALPNMRVKQDAIPGMEIPVHFVPTEPTPEENRFPKCVAGKTCWEIACAQLCGLSHYNMRGFLTVHEEGGFEEWIAGKLAG